MTLLLSKEGMDCEEISDLKGLNRRSPWMAGVLLLTMFSLAGLPPLVGFTAKLLILQALLQSDHLWIAVYAVMFSLIGAFYYLRVLKVMYFDDPDTDAAPVPKTAWPTSTLMIINSLAVLGLGLLPSDLINLCVRAIQTAFT